MVRTSLFELKNGSRTLMIFTFVFHSAYLFQTATFLILLQMVNGIIRCYVRISRKKRPTLSRKFQYLKLDPLIRLYGTLTRKVATLSNQATTKQFLREHLLRKNQAPPHLQHSGNELGKSEQVKLFFGRLFQILCQQWRISSE